MIKRLIQFFKGEITITKPCTCGQQADGICTVNIEVSRTGVLSQQTAQLLQCGKVQKQMEVASAIIANQRAKTIKEGKVVKGGWNPAPTTPRPTPPPGRSIKEGEQPTKSDYTRKE